MSGRARPSRRGAGRMPMPPEVIAVATSGTDWDAFRKCRICGVDTGKACRALTGYKVVDGVLVSQDQLTECEVPHGTRKRRARR